MRWRERLFEPVAAHSLAFFRIAFGALLLWEIGRFFESGWIDTDYVAPRFHFKYFGFGWVEALPQPWLSALVGGLGVLCGLIVLGWWTRVAAGLFFVGFGYLFTLEAARYLNHFYLVLLLALLLTWVPTDGVWSLRAARHGERSAPRWGRLLFCVQLAMVYGFAALAKVNGDWLHGEPLRIWLKGRADLPWVGPLLAHAWAPWVMSYAGLLLDLLVVPLLVWRRTRPWMFVAITTFHVANMFLFDIGIFPWLAIAATTLFFAPDWPRRLVARVVPLARIGRPRASLILDVTAVVDAARAPGAAPVSHAVQEPDTDTALAPTPDLVPKSAVPGHCMKWNGGSRCATLTLLAAWLAVQLLLPLRHVLYPGPVSWTEEGHLFSWHMKLRSKVASAHFVVTDPATAERRLVDPREELSEWQARKMAGRPELILQYAHHLAERLAVVDPVSGVHRRQQVRAIVDCSLNGRDPQPLVDPDVDLAAIESSLAPATWIVPLHERLPPVGRPGGVEFEE